MADCNRDSKDPLLSQLMKLGVNVVVPPRDGIGCGDLIISDRAGGARRADWSSVLGVVPSPETAAGGAFTSLDLNVSDKLDRSFGAKVLGRIFDRLGSGSGSLSAALSKTGCTRLSIRLTAPATRRLTNLDGLLDHLRSEGARPAPAYESSRLHIVEAVWRARGVEIATYSAQDTSLDVSTEVEQELSAGFGLKSRRVGDGLLAFDAPQALIFGVGVRQILFDGGLVTDVLPTRYLKVRNEAEKDVLDPDDPFTEVSD